MSVFRWRGTVLRQFWSSFAIVLVLNQFVVLGSIYLFLFKPAVASFSALAAAWPVLMPAMSSKRQ